MRQARRDMATFTWDRKFDREFRNLALERTVAFTLGQIRHERTACWRD
jgi:hypothetical protein